MNTTNGVLRHCLPLLPIFSLALAAGATEPPPRERLLLDFGWKFHLGNEWGIAQNLAKAGTGFGPAAPSFSDASWRTVDLPHDWAIELPFDPKAEASHGFRAVGPRFERNSVAWYRRSFELPGSDTGRRIWLEFDGVYRDSTVFVNGWFVGQHASGYHPVRYDITDVANCGGSNVISVKVDASHNEGWFYEGAGIYRHVWLVKTGPIAIAPDGIFVHSSFRDASTTGPATVHFETEVANSLKSTSPVVVSWEITAPDGSRVAATDSSGPVPDLGSATVVGSAIVDSPELWSPETPRLYTLTTTVTSDGAVCDRKETKFGIRTFAFDVERGFLLNGKPYLIKGTCNHQDHAGVGAAVPDALQDFRIRRLKDIGMNAYRSAHNPATVEVLEACDRIGMLVMDECRLVSSDARNLGWLADLIRRDRNHASVAIWSIGNEEFTIEATPAGARVAGTMQDLVRRLDPSRPVTYNAPLGNVFEGINSVIEVRGWSYRVGEDRMDAYHRAHPGQPNVGSEQGSTTTTRGIYAKDPERGYESAYDDNAQPWSNTAKEWWGFFATRPWLSGGFVWTGFDYRGEPTPYAWPCINSHFGILDTCGFRKDISWYYTAWWTDTTVLHLMPHWNWAGRGGETIDVRALSNCDEVELFLNGASLGKQPMPRNSEIKWSVPYSPGTLSAKGYKGGELVAEKVVETTGAPAAVTLEPDRPAISADGEDLVVVKVSIHDAEGRMVPTASDAVSFAIDGPGRIIGVGNGDPSCHEPDKFFTSPVIKSVDLGGWRWTQIENGYADSVPQVAPDFDDSTWAPWDASSETGPLGVMQHGAFRTTFESTPEMLVSEGVELWIAKINSDARVYLNGTRVGLGSGPGAPTVLNLKSALREGTNVLAATIGNYGDQGGINSGANLRLVSKAPPAQWSRSVFNGLAQVIVQASKETGTITLTATAGGLQPARLQLAAEAIEPRPAVP